MAHTILIADDEVFWLHLLKFTIEDALLDVQVQLVRSGVEVLRSALRSAPDLLIVDIVMPDMTGVEVISALAYQVSEYPILLLTAYDSRDIDKHFPRDVASRVELMTKPEDVELIVEAIQRMLPKMEQ